MKLAHIGSDTSHGPRCASPVRAASARPMVVRCTIRCSASLSNSMVNATSTWDSKVGSGGVGSGRVGSDGRRRRRSGTRLTLAGR